MIGPQYFVLIAFLLTGFPIRLRCLTGRLGSGIVHKPAISAAALAYTSQSQ